MCCLAQGPLRTNCEPGSFVSAGSEAWETTENLVLRAPVLGAVRMGSGSAPRRPVPTPQPPWPRLLAVPLLCSAASGIHRQQSCTASLGSARSEAQIGWGLPALQPPGDTAPRGLLGGSGLGFGLARGRRGGQQHWLREEPRVPAAMAAILLRLRPKVPISFEDVSVYFTKAEWKFLDFKQKALYKQVMLDNYRNLASLGLACSKPHLVAQLERGEGPWVADLRWKAGGRLQSPGAARRNPRQGDTAAAAQRGPQGRGPAPRPQRPKGSEKRYLCQQCGKSFSRSSNLIKHRIVHSGEKPYACPECGKQFRRSFALLEHRRIHSGEKPFACDECGKTFTRSSNLVKHQIVHSGEKPYCCAECGKLFRRSFALLEHERIHSGERPYECVHCGKAFSRSSNLIEHERTHSGQRPYLCDQCPKAFTGISQLIHHQRSHSGGRPFACRECGKAFRGRSGLSQHLRAHSGEKPYECSECGKAFGRRANLFKHQAVHGDLQPARRRGRDRGSRRRGCMLLLGRRRGPRAPRPREAGEGSSAEARGGRGGPAQHACERCERAAEGKAPPPRHWRAAGGKASFRRCPRAQPVGGGDGGPRAGGPAPAKPQEPASAP
ncbi:zinc finger protein 92 homolog [Cavia porcellus]|uniref:zinc finger protein 92 homolog n=1 Tax=Cavia porcellus TaxID=10141 RepID=UPI002FE41FC9